MTSDRETARLSTMRFAVAIAASAALVLSAPFIGQLRSAIRNAFPGEFVTIAGSAVGFAAAVAIVAALIRIRDRRLLRYGLLVAALVLAATYSVRSELGNPESDAVERFHFIEYGLITFLFYRAWRPLGDGAVFVLPVLAGFVVGTCEEWFQWFIPARIGELRDVLLNGAAIVTGLLFSLAVDPPNRVTLVLRPRSVRQVGGVAILTTIVFASFLKCVHVGFEIRDSEVGAFRSIYSAADLQSLAADRSARWAAAPPPVRPPRVSREDQYLSEGLLHVQARNRAWESGNIESAWYENRILEKYFAPVLTIGHAWPAEQRADAERRARLVPGSPATFVSRAQGEFPIYTWSPAAFWTAIAAVVAAIAVGMILADRASRRHAVAAVSARHA